MTRQMETYSPCRVCGTAIRQFGGPHVKYCSPECKREARKKAGAVR